MQLVLMHRSVKFMDLSGDYFIPTYHSNEERLSETDVSCSSGKEEVAQKLISELFKGKSSGLKVVLRKDAGSPHNYIVTIKYAGGKFDILESLRDRFHDKAKIAISIAVGENDVDCEGSTKEMIIQKSGGDHRCEGSIQLFLDPFKEHEEKGDIDSDEESKIGSFTALLTITAHICLSDDEITSGAEIPPGKKILEQGLFSDVTILAMDGVELAAHKNFLSACSPVLQTQFGGKWEKESNSKVDMSDVSEKGVRAFLRYVYYQELAEAKKDPEIVFELLHIAHQYDMTPLETRAIGHFLDMKDKDIKMGLALKLYAFVRNIDSAKELKSKSANILMLYTDKMENLPEFKKLLKENPTSTMELRNEILRGVHSEVAHLLPGMSVTNVPNKKQKLDI